MAEVEGGSEKGKRIKEVRKKEVGERRKQKQKRKNDGSEESGRKMGDLKWERGGSEIWRGGQKISFSKVL